MEDGWYYSVNGCKGMFLNKINLFKLFDKVITLQELLKNGFRSNKVKSSSELLSVIQGFIWWINDIKLRNHKQIGQPKQFYWPSNQLCP